jgi:hypothetical protein
MRLQRLDGPRRYAEHPTLKTSAWIDAREAVDPPLQRRPFRTRSRRADPGGEVMRIRTDPTTFAGDRGPAQGGL